MSASCTAEDFIERRQVQSDVRIVAFGPVGVLLEETRAGQHHAEQRHVAITSQGKTDEFERTVVRPVQVVQHYYDGAAVAQTAQVQCAGIEGYRLELSLVAEQFL